MDARAQLGEQIRKLRTAKALTLEELAFRSGMDYTHISGIERGRRNPSFAALIDLSRALNVHPSELLSEIVVDGTVPVPRKRGQVAK
jgi:transcriptional regulator with XRE-family HTH domain